MGAVQWRNTRESFLKGIREEIQIADFPAAQNGFHFVLDNGFLQIS